MQIQVIAGYKFTALSDLDLLRDQFIVCCEQLSLRGTILLSEEGININLAGASNQLDGFMQTLKQDPRFNDMHFHISYTQVAPYKRLKVKLKEEIITFRQSRVKPTEKRAPSIKPNELKQWLDEGRDITVLDTRNDYEISHGTFTKAQQLDLHDFCEFSSSVNKIDRHKPIVMFCTGGIRCEKAALHLLNEGFANVYQLDGGILGYFKEIGDAHYKGGCFVFDERVALDTNLNVLRDHSATE